MSGRLGISCYDFGVVEGVVLCLVLSIRGLSNLRHVFSKCISYCTSDFAGCTVGPVSTLQNPYAVRVAVFWHHA